MREVWIFLGQPPEIHLRSQATLPINTNKIKAMLFFEGKVFSYQQNLWMQKNVVSQVILELVFTVNFSVESVF